MRLIHTTVLCLSLLLCLFLAGCGGVVDREQEPLLRAGKGKGGNQAVVAIKKREYLPIDAKDYKGVIKGKILWQGGDDFAKHTESVREQMSKNNDNQYCTSGSEHERIQQKFRVGKNKGLGNVFVWIAPPAGTAFNVPDSQLPANKDVVISQPHCAFLPHCAAVFSARYKDGKIDTTGCQALVVQNDATVPHNALIQGTLIQSNKLLGKWDKVGKPATERFELQPEKSAIAIKCSIHGWMTAYVRAFEHPYCAVSSVGADLKDLAKPKWENLDDPAVGTYELRGVPIGAKVKLFAWHEELGDLLGATGKDITITADMTEDIPAKP